MNIMPSGASRRMPQPPATYTETTKSGISLSVPVGTTLHYSITKCDQEFHVFTHPQIGWVMTLNGQLQNCALDSTYYHEIMAHVPLIAHGNVSRALIAGGASGALAGEVLKHQRIQIDVVEIDSEIRDACKQCFPEYAKSFESPRVTSIFSDVVAFLAATNTQYDAMFFDLPDFDQGGPVELLSPGRILSLLQRSLTPEGVAVFQSSVPFHGNESIIRNLIRMAKAAAVRFGVFASPSPLFPGGLQTFIWVSAESDIERHSWIDIEQRYRAAALDTAFYSPSVHMASLAMASRIASSLGV